MGEIFHITDEENILVYPLDLSASINFIIPIGLSDFVAFILVYFFCSSEIMKLFLINRSEILIHALVALNKLYLITVIKPSF